MTIGQLIFVLLFLLLIAGGLIYLLIYPIVRTLRWAYHNRRQARNKPARIMPRRKRVIRRLDVDKGRLLNHYILHYKHLSRLEQAEFLYRVQDFITSKRWFFQDEALQPHKEVIQTVVAGAAVQITFNLPAYTAYPHFKAIYIYATDFQSPSTGNYHKGEVNPRQKAIVLSWEHIQKGFADSNDALNLALHEMAHALRFEYNSNYSETIRGIFNHKAKEQYNKLAIKELSAMRHGDSEFLRDYGATNLEEFFSVSVEAFYEQPHRFAREVPQLYQQLTVLLNQDPRQYMPKTF